MNIMYKVPSNTKLVSEPDWREGFVFQCVECQQYFAEGAY